MHPRKVLSLVLLAFGSGLALLACHDAPEEQREVARASSDLGTQAHLDFVMTSASCARCHPAIYAEHQQNTHGRAFFDEEARTATRGFRREDCLRCHAPRPIFETGIGMTPMQRWTDLEEANTCMSCHWKSDYDYSRFEGGRECKTAFDPRAGTVEACSSCHRIAGTPDQWSRAARGQAAGNLCLDCHMPLVERPVAVGEPVRSVHSHLFPAAHSDSQLRRAYAYDAAIEGDEVVVRITNKGAGHNFPTATRQRAVESLIVVRDEQGNEVSRSRMVCRYPYALELAPHQMTLPISTQIPSGKTREHRVPLKVANGTVECSLFYKLYRPIDDDEPRLSRRLEDRRLAFDGVTPSPKPVADAPLIGFPAPEANIDEAMSPAGYVNLARPAPGSGEVIVPTGSSADDLKRLVALLEFHLPEARARARERLAELGPVAWPALVAALGHWSNETFNEAKAVFVRIGPAAAPALLDALSSEQLYVRIHARELLAILGFPGERTTYLDALERGLAMATPLDRRSSAIALGELGDASATTALRARLEDGDWDVVMAAAASLAMLRDRDSVPAIERALNRAPFLETQRELAVALARLGSASGLRALLDGLGHPDELRRESFFESFFSVTGVHFGFDPAAPENERVEAMARLQSWWEQNDGHFTLREPRRIDRATRERTWELVEALGGGSDTVEGGDDRALLDELVAFGEDAVPALVEGLTFPPGFSAKRAFVCEALGRIGSKEAAPFLAAALRDPVPSVTEWACWALEATRDPSTLGQLRNYEYRVPRISRAGESIDLAMQDRLYARVRRTRWMLGDERARDGLVQLLLSEDLAARQIAITALAEKYGDARGYDASADAPARRESAAKWKD